MSEALLVFAILAATIAAFASDRFRLDLVAVVAMLALAVTGVLTPAQPSPGSPIPSP